MQHTDIMQTQESLLTLEQVQALFEPYIPTPTPSPPEVAASLPYSLLNTVFGLSDFLPGQSEAISYVLEQKDCFLRMATGSGKSLVWQLPSIIHPRQVKRLTIAIFPIKALINDQMSKLCRLWPMMEAVSYHGGQPQDLNRIALELLNESDELPDCLLVLPEALQPNHPIYERLVFLHQRGRIARFVLDEADKILDWGTTFRTEYLQVARIRDIFPNIPILAMTGSITNGNMQSTIEYLKMRETVKVVKSLDRPNLYYEIRQKTTKYGCVQDIIREISEGALSGPGLIYCTTVDETKYLAQRLRNKCIPAASYYGALNEEQRKKVERLWKSGELQVIVATVAFGMGIDKKDVRWVVHDSMPPSIERWQQESGRAGRDGIEAKCVVYFQSEDYIAIRNVATDRVNDSDLPKCLRRLHDVLTVLLARTCRRSLLLNHYNETYPRLNCGACDICCLGANEPTYEDSTKNAIKILEILKEMPQIGVNRNCNWTEKKLVKAIRGYQYVKKKEKSCGKNVSLLKNFGCQLLLPLKSGRTQRASEEQILEFIFHLISEKVISEIRRPGLFALCSDGRYQQRVQFYIKPGPRANLVLEGRIPVHFSWSKHSSERE